MRYQDQVNCEVHLLSHDLEEILPWALRHYLKFASVVVHDGGPEGWSTITAERMGAKAVPWDTSGKLNDELAMNLKNECWKGTDADWVICADADELVYFPEGATVTLSAYSRMGAAVIKPEGYEMFSEIFPTGEGQIYDQIKEGSREDKWYAKPILFSPKKVKETGFGIGAHDAFPVLHNGMVIHTDKSWPNPNPRALLLHYHQIGPIERVASRYDDTRKRLARVNEMNRWGNFKPGLAHAQEKRAYILPRLQQVVA
jgi:Glycosyl transferase family 2